MRARRRGGGGGHGGSHGGSHYTYVYVPGGQGAPIVPFVQPGDYSHIHRVAIISAIGQSMTLGSIALLSSHSTLDIAAWNMDQTVETIIANHLKDRFEVKNVTHDRAAVAQIPNSHFDTSSAKTLAAYLAGLDAKDVDAFIVVRPDAEAGSLPTPGLSLDTPDGAARPYEEANFEIDVIEAGSGRMIARAFSRAQTRRGVTPQFAVIYGPEDLRLNWKDTPSPAQFTEMKTGFERLVSMSLRETLRAMNFGIALPAVGERNLVPIPPEKDPFRKLNKVMVVSAVGDRLGLDHRGTWFEHKQTVQPVADWNMDAEFEKRVASGLDKHFVQTSVPVDRAKLAAFAVKFDKASMAMPVDGITPGADVDAYVVLLKYKIASGDDTTGLGLFNVTPYGDETTQVFANYAIAIVDGKTAKIVWVHRGVASPLHASPIPVRQAANSDWPKDGGAFTPEQAAATHALFSDMMGDSIDETLLDMVLTGKTVAAREDDLASFGDDGVASPPPDAAAPG
ncbi:MAG TPA: hypothetical protein VFV07_04415, partial [Rhizomicrobium sp.]|nr:hypothetical protein [Rhizomicrobium sp.]